MRRPRIVWRVPPGSIYRTTHGGTRLVVDKAKLRARCRPRFANRRRTPPRCGAPASR